MLKHAVVPIAANSKERSEFYLAQLIAQLAAFSKFGLNSCVLSIRYDIICDQTQLASLKYNIKVRDIFVCPRA